MIVILRCSSVVAPSHQFSSHHSLIIISSVFTPSAVPWSFEGGSQTCMFS